MMRTRSLIDAIHLHRFPTMKKNTDIKIVINTMSIMRMCSVAGFALFAVAVWSQDYPLKPIRMVTPGTGGGGDFVARVISPGLSAALGKQVVVDNRPNGVIPGEIVSKAPPDGYTVLLASSPLWIGTLLQRTPYDVLRDFTPVTLIGVSPLILVVSPAVPVKTVKDLIDLAKAKPNALNYSSASTGSASHLAAELFKMMTAVNIARIPYKSGSAEITDLISGQVQLTFGAASSFAPQVKAGRLRGVAVTSLRPSPLFPDLPTVAATVPGFEEGSMYGLLVPANTPKTIVTRLHQELAKVLNTASVKEKFAPPAIEVLAQASEQFSARMKSEMERMGKVVKEAGLRKD